MRKKSNRTLGENKPKQSQFLNRSQKTEDRKQIIDDSLSGVASPKTEGQMTEDGEQSQKILILQDRLDILPVNEALRLIR